MKLIFSKILHFEVIDYVLCIGLVLSVCDTFYEFERYNQRKGLVHHTVTGGGHVYIDEWVPRQPFITLKVKTRLVAGTNGLPVWTNEIVRTTNEP